MGHSHPSTPAQRAQWAATMIAHQGDYGIVSRLSREHQVSRPTLYAWREQAAAALSEAFTPAPASTLPTPHARHILTLWIAHASVRGIQAATRELLATGLSLATISAVLHEAQRRAQHWMLTHTPSSTRALALDEIYANNRRGAYLNVVDVQSGAVWATEGPLPVDTESWTLVLWSLQERELHFDRVVMDDAPAMHAACREVVPSVEVQLDQWHLWHVSAQVQGRVERVVTRLQQQSATVARQAARVAQGQPARGRNAKSDVAAHAAELAAAKGVADGLRYLTEELRELLGVVVLRGEVLLTPQQRHSEIAALMSLLNELAHSGTSSQQAEVQRVVRRIDKQLPQLLAFQAHIAQVQEDLGVVLTAQHQALVAWAWQRREVLEWDSKDIEEALPEQWRGAVRVLLVAWDSAVTVSSAVERWHSIMRPHLAVRRTLSGGMLALLAVWHNHRVFTRGKHKGKSPLHLSGMTDAPSDWLVALGYEPAQTSTLQPACVALAA